VNICYSAYSPRRTGNREYFPGSPEQLKELRAQFERVEARRDRSNYIVSAPSTIEATRRYFETGGTRAASPACAFWL